MPIPFRVIIPARFASSRLPGKVLLAIDGKPMIQHVYERASQSDAQQVVVATDDKKVFDCVTGFGGEVVMTAATHESGTDRLQEAAAQLLLADKEIVVNVQGDEPLIPPEVINQVAENLATDDRASVATLCAPIGELDEFRDPNAVKVVMTEQHRALYFSRAPIPWPRDAFLINRELTNRELDGSEADAFLLNNCFRHIGIYAYRVGLLHRFITWPVAPLEALEKLEQLRVLWHGETIHVAPACAAVPAGVDSEADLQRVQRLMIANREKQR